MLVENIVAFFESGIAAAFLPAVLFISGAIFFIRMARYVFTPAFFRKYLSVGGKSTSSLFLALGGTLGVGNICGVASAIYIGGPGCVFWIWVCAFFSAITKYVESLLAVHYKNTEGGGAFSYIEKGTHSKLLAQIFATLCILTAFTMGNVTQVKAAAGFAEISLGLPTIASATVFFFAVLIFACGKGKTVVSFTTYAVPVLCCLYSLCCSAVIVIHAKDIIPLTKQIFNCAFTPAAGISGVWGYLCSPALRLGITRGIMSNEAGCGTAPIAYCSQPNALPVKCGLLGVIEVLVDTLLLCTLTAYAVLLSKAPLSPTSAQSVIHDFESTLGSFIAPVITISVFLFALASVGAWSFYAISCAKYLKARKGFFILFSVLYPLTSFVGCFISEKSSWFLSDLSISLMAITNIIVLLLLSDKAKKITLSAFNSSKS